MNKPAKSIARTLLQALSKSLGVIGAATFLFGDRALREFAKFNFASAEVVGIFSGILLICLSYAIGQTAKNFSPGQQPKSE